MKFKNIILPLICMVLLITLVSALSWDNKVSKKQLTFDGKLINGNELLERYKPIEIKNSFGLGKTLMEGYLSQHTEVCSDDCSSTIEINLLEDGILIDDIRFKTTKGDNANIDYKLYVDRKPYEIGTELKAGKYKVLLEGDKGLYGDIDWIIKSQGQWLDSWAWWRSWYDWNDDFETGTINSSFWTTYTSFGHSCTSAVPSASISEHVGLDGYLELKTFAGDTAGSSSITTLIKTKADYKTGLEYSITFSLNGTKIHNFGINNGSVSTNGLLGTLNIYNIPSNTTINNYSLSLSADGNASLYDGLGVILGTIDISSLDKWYIQFRNFDTGVCDGITYSIQIYNFTSIVSKPIITLNSPAINGTAPPQAIFNCSADVFGGVILTNISLWHNGTGIWSRNQTNIVTGISNTTTFNVNLLRGIDYLSWTCEACQSDNGCDFSIENRTVEIPHININEMVYNSYSYETASETFAINVSANSSLTDVNLIHNTISHDATLSGGFYNVTFDIPSSVGNKSFYWEFTYAGSTINSDSYNQTVNNTLFGICNATLTVPYINFTFKDEETLLAINATIDTSSWTYYLGSGTVTKSLLFSNVTVNDNYPFCFSASNSTLHNTRSIQYASAGYPQRKYDASSDLTNATTNQTLYLLSSADGIYSTIQVLDTNSEQLVGVEVTAERQFSGIWTVVGQEETDSAGAVTFWVNPDYDHKFTFIKSGCTGATITIRPTQTQYTQQLACGVTSDYTATIEGLKYSRTPAGGILQSGVYNFTYYLISSKDNIINASFYLVNASDQSILNSSVSACSFSGCLLYFSYNVSSGDSLKGKYYVDVGNGSILLEGDAWWRCIDIDSDGRAGIQTLFYDVIFIFQKWGSDSNTADFNRLVFIFFFMCVSLSILNYHFNMDTMNPGMFLSLMTFLIVMGSIIGGFSPSATTHGLFYYNNLTTNHFINNYLLAGICMIITFASFLNVNRQAQR